MKKIVLAIVLGTLALTPAQIAAQAGGGSVTAAATGSLAADAMLGAIPVTGVELGAGALIDADGSAVGSLHAVLRANVGGQARDLTLEGKVTQGTIAPDGSATVSGTATLDLGDGTPVMAVSWISLTVSSSGLVLSVDTATLPISLDKGSVAIE